MVDERNDLKHLAMRHPSERTLPMSNTRMWNMSDSDIAFEIQRLESKMIYATSRILDLETAKQEIEKAGYDFNNMVYH